MVKGAGLLYPALKEEYTMKITIDSKITITGATSAKYEHIIKDNRYPNPAIDQAKKMQRKHHHLPHYIYTYEQTEQGLVVPIGYLDELPECEVIDNRTIRPASIPGMDITLRDYQQRLFDKAIQHFLCLWCICYLTRRIRYNQVLFSGCSTWIQIVFYLYSQSSRCAQ